MLSPICLCDRSAREAPSSPPTTSRLLFWNGHRRTVGYDCNSDTSEEQFLKSANKIVSALAIVAMAVLPGRGADPAESRAVMAYYESSGSQESLLSFYLDINQLPTDAFSVNAKGKISGSAPKTALEFARSKGMQTFATVSNFGKGDFDPKIAHSIITHPAIAQRTIVNLLDLVKDSGYSGINIDFESVPLHDRVAFTSFIHDVAGKMHAAGYLIVVSVPAELKDDPNDSWAGAFDFKSLGQDADILQLMTYDEHGPWGEPGPVAGLDWVEPCARFAASVVKSSKVSLGIQAYGYDWDTTHRKGVQVHWNQIPSLIASTGATPQWDTASSSPFFTYRSSDGSSHVVWYEDKTSIPLKSALAKTYHLAGISMFALGYEDKSFWLAVHSGLKNPD